MYERGSRRRTTQSTIIAFVRALFEDADVDEAAATGKAINGSG
jgi:hypothetical protein